MGIVGYACACACIVTVLTGRDTSGAQLSAQSYKPRYNTALIYGSWRGVAMAWPNCKSSSSAGKCQLGQTIAVGDEGALREQRISGVLGPFSSSKSLALAFVVSSERP